MGQWILGILLAIEVINRPLSDYLLGTFTTDSRYFCLQSERETEIGSSSPKYN